MDEAVILAYVTNSAGIFNLTANQIIHLKKSGVAPQVVNAMIRHDQEMLSGARSVMVVATPPPPAESQIVANDASWGGEPLILDDDYYAPEQPEGISPVSAPTPSSSTTQSSSSRSRPSRCRIGDRDGTQFKRRARRLTAWHPRRKGTRYRPRRRRLKSRLLSPNAAGSGRAIVIANLGMSAKMPTGHARSRLAGCAHIERDQKPVLPHRRSVK